MKYLLIAAIVLVVYLAWRHQRAQERAEQRRPPPQTAAPGAPPALPQDMVRCPVCAVHLPRSEALADGQGHLFCSAEHRRLGSPRP